MIRRALATAVVAALAAIPVAPASAELVPLLPDPPSGKVAITITGEYTGVFVSGLQIVANCDAAAAGAVSAIVIDQCYLTSNGNNHASTLPGNATSSNFTEQVTTLDFNLCFHAYAIPVTDPTHPATAGGCASPVGDGATDVVGLSGVGGLGSAFSTN